MSTPTRSTWTRPTSPAGWVRGSRAILAVHYGGQPADLAELSALAADAGVVLLEDAAEAHGARYRGRHVGTWGVAGMFSFTPTKNITTGEGGMVITGDGDLARRLRLQRNHGQVSPYEHAVLGCNWRLSEMQAAMGRAQTAKLDAILARKRTLAADLDRRLDPVAGVQAPVVRGDRDHVHMLYTVTLATADAARRDAVIDDLAQQGIESRVYFPPAHRQPVFGGQPADVPVTDDLAGRILSLPIHSLLTPDEVADVAAALAAADGPHRRRPPRRHDEPCCRRLAWPSCWHPVLAVVAVLVRLADGRPLLFVHQRAGLDGRPFGLLKFRTMRPPGSPRGARRRPHHPGRSPAPSFQPRRAAGTVERGPGRDEPRRSPSPARGLHGRVFADAKRGAWRSIRA